MPDFTYIKCPNCHIKIKIDASKKYQDCPDCKYEFKLEDASPYTKTNDPEKKESIFGKFLKENQL